ncbi:MAG: hypothetical protein WC788_06365 [Candidatus Paceibacterota bacterium]|jgi:hypothetical protein
MAKLFSKINKDAACLFFVAAAGFFFMLFFKEKHSISFMNLDEFLWMYRSRFFIDRIMGLDFGNLIQSSQPGIMVMWFAGPFMKLIDFDFTKIQLLIQNLNEAGGYNVINDTGRNYYVGYEFISFMFNIPVILLMLVFFPASYSLMRRLGIGRRAIFLSLLLIATTPYYVFFTTPTDKLVGIFSTLSILSFLVFLAKKGGKGFIYLSGFVGSWAALTKMSALFLIPFFLFALLVYVFKKSDLADLKVFQKKAGVCAKVFSGWLLAFIVTSIIFLPTIITDPRQVAGLFIRESDSRYLIQNAEAQDPGSLSLFDSVRNYLEDPFLPSFNFFVIMAFLAFLFLIIRRIEYKINVRKEILLLYIFVFSFLIFSATFSRTYSFRYIMPALVVFQIISGWAVYEFFEIFRRKNSVYSRNEIFAWAVVVILISQALLIHYSEIAPIE